MGRSKDKDGKWRNMGGANTTIRLAAEELQTHGVTVHKEMRKMACGHMSTMEHATGLCYACALLERKKEVGKIRPMVRRATFDFEFGTQRFRLIFKKLDQQRRTYQIFRETGDGNRLAPLCPEQGLGGAGGVDQGTAAKLMCKHLGVVE